MAIFLTICLVWGSNFILMHRASVAFGPLTISFWRLALGGGVLLFCWLWSDRQKIASRDWPHLLVVSLIGNTVPFSLLPLLISRGFGHSFFAVVIGFVPLVTILASAVMLAVLPTPRQLIGVLGGLAALALLLWDGSTRGMSVETLMLAASVPLSYAIANTYIRWQLGDAPALIMTAVLFSLGAGLLLPVCMAVRQSAGPAQISAGDWWVAVASLIWLGIVGTGLTGVAFIRLIQSRGPLYAGMAAYLVPLVALAWGAYDAEPITFSQLLTMATVVVMVILVQGRSPGWRYDRSRDVSSAERT